MITWIGVILSIIASLILAVQRPAPARIICGMFMLSNLCLIYTFFNTQQWNLLLLQCVFLATSIIGIIKR